MQLYLPDQGTGRSLSTILSLLFTFLLPTSSFCKTFKKLFDVLINVAPHRITETSLWEQD